MEPVLNARMDGLVDAVTIGVGCFGVLAKLGIRRCKKNRYHCRRVVLIFYTERSLHRSFL